MARVVARVVPRCRAPGLERREGGLVLRVRAAPEGGRATEEARRVLAEALGVPPSRVRLSAGPRSRTKVFGVEGLSEEEVAARLARW